MGRKRFVIILVLVAAASFAIVLDRLVQPQSEHVDFHEGPTTSATTLMHSTPRP